MRLVRNFAGVVAAALLIVGLAAAPATAYRAMTWNIGGSPTSSAGAQFDLNEVQVVISRSSPDIVALQEVCAWQANALGQSLGYHWHETAIGRFNDGRTGSGGTCDYGNALLSKTEIPAGGRYRTELLAPSEGCKYDAYQGSGFPECRVDMGALIHPSGGSIVRSASAHIGTAGEPYTPPHNQSLELSRLLGDASTNADEAATAGTVLMMGDYNVTSEDPRMAPKLEALGYADGGGSVAGQTCASTTGCEYTYPSGGSYGTPAYKGDYVYYRNLRLDGHGAPEPLVNGHEASDHRPIVADLSSLAAPPETVTLTTPPNGSAGNVGSPLFSGKASTTAGSSDVTVSIYGGQIAAGTPVQPIGGVPVAADGSWSTRAGVSLADGVYSAQARQTDAGGSVRASQASMFTVDTLAPRVTLISPTNGSSSPSTPTFIGAAGTSSGDATSVTVKIYNGASATGTQIQTLSAAVSNGSWSVVSMALAPGTYAARAEQVDAAGNTGLSSPNTFVIRGPAVATTARLVAPAVFSPHVAPNRFRLGSALPRTSRRVPRGTTISFGLSEPARVTLAFARRMPGRRVGRRCVAPSRRSRRGRACTRPLPVGSLTFNGHAGRNRVAFQGRLSRRKTLKPGLHDTTITAIGAAGSRSRPVAVSFTALPAR